jgi:tetratricopeptide (TPR) repeat protein
LQEVRKDNDKAEQFYLRAIEADLDNYRYMEKLGDFYRHLGRSEDAIPILKRATELHQDVATLWNDLGNVYRDSNVLAMAIEAYQKAIALEPRQQVYKDNLGNVYMELGIFERAIETYIEMGEIDPKSFGYISLITCYLKTGQNQKATELMEVAESHAESPLIFIGARVAAVHKNVDQALLLLQKSLETGSISRAWVRHDPNFDFIHDDPRFQELIGE